MKKQMKSNTGAEKKFASGVYGVVKSTMTLKDKKR